MYCFFVKIKFYAQFVILHCLLMSKKTKTYSFIGEVAFVKSRRARRLTLSVRPNRGVRITLPWYAAWNDAEAFLLNQMEWVKEKIKRARQFEGQSVLPLYKSGDQVIPGVMLKLVPHDKTTCTSKLHDNILLVAYPSGISAGDPALQSAIHEAIGKSLRKKACEYLPHRTAWLAEKHGFRYRRVSIRGSRTRWGSCSAVNNINLSIYLMQLPGHLIDYVILHELTHTRHKNHGPAFWELLEKHTGNARALAREIKKYRIAY